MLGGGPLGAQTTDPVGAQAAQLFAQAQPHLEEVLGVKFQRPPQFRGATVEDLRRRHDPELIAYLRWQFPHLTGDTFQTTLAVTRYLALSATAVERAELLMLPEMLLKPWS